MATPDYVLTEDYSHYIGPQDTRLIKAGSFVRPIEFGYLPVHIRKNNYNEWAVFHGGKLLCYTHYGIIAIPKSMMRKV